MRSIYGAFYCSLLLHLTLLATPPCTHFIQAIPKQGSIIVLFSKASGKTLRYNPDTDQVEGVGGEGTWGESSTVDL